MASPHRALRRPSFLRNWFSSQSFSRTNGIAAVGSSRAHQERSGVTPRQDDFEGKNKMTLPGYGRGVVCYIA